MDRSNTEHSDTMATVPRIASMVCACWQQVPFNGLWLHMAQMYRQWGHIPVADGITAMLLFSAVCASNFGRCRDDELSQGVKLQHQPLSSLCVLHCCSLDNMLGLKHCSAGPPFAQGCIHAAMLLVEGDVDLVIVEGIHVGLEGATSLVVGQRHRHPLNLRQHREADRKQHTEGGSGGRQGAAPGWALGSTQ